MTKEKIKEKVIDIFDNICMFLWMLVPMTPMLATSALMFLDVYSVWFWVSCITPIIPIVIIRPHIGSCSQWENVYWMSIMSAVVVFILRICGVFPIA